MSDSRKSVNDSEGVCSQIFFMENRVETDILKTRVIWKGSLLSVQKDFVFFFGNPETFS